MRGPGVAAPHADDMSRDTADEYEGERAIDVVGLAQMLSISIWKAQELGKDPLFPSFKVGNSHRFWPSAVREYVNRPRDPWKQSAQSLGRKRIGR
jgi:hypothetical protein